MARQEFIDAVRAHALEHYQDGGWDVIYECYDDAMIAEIIDRQTVHHWKGRGGVWKSKDVGPARSANGAIQKVYHAVVTIYADRQADARNSAF